MSTQQLTNLRVTNKMVLPINTNLATINGQSLIALRESVNIVISGVADGNYGDVVVTGGGTIWTVVGGGGGGNGYFPQGW